ncbi:MAG: HAMP domain-containing protein [Clostridiales bacterium]|nr:HAMP domain-containing protein [Clostridiales bacterium]
MLFNNSTLMRRTVLLVLGALCASMAFATIAFKIAGQNATLSIQIESAFKKSEAVKAMLADDPVIYGPGGIEFLFGENDITECSTYIFSSDGSVLLPRGDDAVSTRDEEKTVDFIRENMLGGLSENDDQYQVTNIRGRDLIIIQSKLSDEGLYLVMATELMEDSVMNQYINILLLSTFAAALTMLIPVIIMVRRIIEPIQDVNKVARSYGRGDYNVRANEDSKGEVGELAASFNKMADRLSKSINDLTVERNRLEDIFNVISEGIVVFNEIGNPTVMNDTMNGIFAKVPKKNLFTEKLHLIPFEDVWHDVNDCLAEGQKKERLIEGPDYAYQVTLVPKFDMDDGSKCIGATGFFRDITEELKLERTRKDYVANISHELRTPLQTLRGLIEPLADGMVRDEEKRQKYYGIILNETLRLSRLIDDMLELSKLQSRTLAFKMYPFDINTLLSDLETKFQAVMRESQIKFSLFFTTGKLPTVMGNPDRVEQILVILLDNAKKYTPAGGSITISAEYNDIADKVMISVIDTGQGIHEYDINHIFDRFFKADRARGKKGTGLGLAIAKELLAYMGEEITVESEYGKGTTFTFTLKRAEANNVWL